MKKYLMLLILFTPLLLHAESFTQVTKVSGLTSDGEYVRVVLEDMLEAEGCKNQNYYFLDVTGEPGKIMLQILLAAHTNKEKVSIQIDGCQKIEDREYPVVTHVYFCDTEYCG